MTGSRGIHLTVLSRRLSAERQLGVKTFLESQLARPAPDACALPPESPIVSVTFPRLLLDHAKSRPLAPALREKNLGIWQTLTWSDLAALVRAMACGLAEAGLTPVAAPALSFQYDWGVQATLDLHAAGERPDAFFGANDIIAIGVLDALRQLGRRVPQDVSVIGFDDIQESARLAYRLTTIRQPLETMIEDALRALDDPQPGHGPRLHPGELIWRDTVRGTRP